MTDTTYISTNRDSHILAETGHTLSSCAPQLQSLGAMQESDNTYACMYDEVAS